MGHRVFIVVVGILCLSACNDKSKQTQIQGTQLSVSITLDSLPDSITYNKATTPEGYVEYSWGVVFDINGDGAINQGDMKLQILHFKSPGIIERTGIISDLDASLWEYTLDTQIIRDVALESVVSGNTITLSISKTAHPSLTRITESTLAYFESSTYDPTTMMSKFDYYPSFSTLTGISPGGNFTDPLGDAQFAYIDMLSMKISL